MKYILNSLPAKTTNHFKINNIELDLEIPNYKKTNDYSIIGSTDKLTIEEKEINEKITTKVGLEFNKYYELNITVPKNIIIDDAILIDYAFENNDVLVDKISINYEENSSCNFIINYISKDDSISFHHLLEKTISSKNSKGNITYINLMNKKSTNIIAIENDVLENSNITHNIIDIGANTRLYNIYSNIKEENGINNLNNIYIGNNDNIIDMNYYLINGAKRTHNNLKVEGSLNDKAIKNFRGTIDFLPGCSESIGEEIENCVLLSNTCNSKSLPQMLCGEENVVGTHGVSSGTVEKEKLFYLMSRGISKKEAEKLIIMSNFNKIIDNIPNESIRKFITNTIEENV